MIDQAAVDFAFLNSKAARKRLIKVGCYLMNLPLGNLISVDQFLTAVPKNRTDLLPHYSRLVATLSKYMPDIGSELVVSVSRHFQPTVIHVPDKG